jgi:hypothetical protein
MEGAERGFHAGACEVSAVLITDLATTWLRTSFQSSMLTALRMEIDSFLGLFSDN